MEEARHDKKKKKAIVGGSVGKGDLTMIKLNVGCTKDKSGQ